MTPPFPIPAFVSEVDAQLQRVASVIRLMPSLDIDDMMAERARLVADLERGDHPVPRWKCAPNRIDVRLFRTLERASATIGASPLAELYLPRIEELSLELHIMEAMGEARRIKSLAARRFGTGRTEVTVGQERLPLAEVARAIIASTPHEEERRVVPASDPQGGHSLQRLMLLVAESAGLALEVVIEPTLCAGAATGERTIFLAERNFGRRECLRFAVHEVLGHAIAAANARDQPIRLFQIGTADSFSGQEGLCLWLEEQAGVLDAYRRRILAARVLAVDKLHNNAHFGDCARFLHREVELSAADSIALTERAYRGGGIARDAGYLRGWLEVRQAIMSGDVTVDDLRAGRLGLEAAAQLPKLIELGYARPARRRPITADHAPSLAVSRLATEGGTNADTFPPNFAASLTRLEET